MFLFARWMSTCYADTVEVGRTSVLNTESGEWWKEQLDHFNEKVYPNYIKNGTVEDTEEYLKNA
jgi:hypothetical protein